MPLAVERRIMGFDLVTRFPRRNAGRDAALQQAAAEPAGIVAAIGDQDIGFRNGRQEKPRTDVVGRLARREKQADRPGPTSCRVTVSLAVILSTSEPRLSMTLIFASEKRNVLRSLASMRNS